MMFQDPVASLSPRRTVRSLVTEPFIIHGMRDRDLDAEASRLLGMVGLNADFFGRYPHELSGGQARRVGVAPGRWPVAEADHRRRATAGSMSRSRAKS